MRPAPSILAVPPPRDLPSPDQVRAIRIAALELLLAIEMAGVRAEPESDFVATLHKLAENPVREDLRPMVEAAR